MIHSSLVKAVKICNLQSKIIYNIGLQSSLDKIFSNAEQWREFEKNDIQRNKNFFLQLFKRINITF
jgi:hypothetical protein